MDSKQKKLLQTALGSTGKSKIAASKSIGIFNEKYTLLRLLGEGTTSRVYLAVRHEDNENVAIKIFKSEFLQSSDKARQIYIDELQAYLKLKHPNIVEMYEYGITGKIVGAPGGDIEGLWFIALEYISERTMVDVIKQYSCLNEKQACYFFK